MKRRTLTRLARVRVFDRHQGICHVCGFRIQVHQKWECEHVVALADGGTDDPSNMAPAHLDPCHRGKTADESTDRSKTVRMRANHLGVPKAGKAKLPCGRDSTKRKKMNGEVVTRVSQASEHRRVMAEREIR